MLLGLGFPSLGPGLEHERNDFGATKVTLVLSEGYAGSCIPSVAQNLLAFPDGIKGPLHTRHTQSPKIETLSTKCEATSSSRKPLMVPLTPPPPCPGLKPQALYFTLRDFKKVP